MDIDQIKDHLGPAAEAGHAAKAAVKEKRFDDAWGLYHLQKSHYHQHASQFEFSARQVLALDASVSEQLANVLRLEGRHPLALTHILYWVIAQKDSPKKRHLTKLKAYFGRCKFARRTLLEVLHYIDSAQFADFAQIQMDVTGWE